ncbi:hypothetical protein C0995_012976 [Termitomyces sp. Mi166|nr:hypothetical protein C0995_012976 [Termitomyces sp. Mi166\
MPLPRLPTAISGAQQPPPQCKSPPPTPSLKESRAYEHDRQRLKKAAVLLARRQAKMKTKALSLVKPQSRSGAGMCVDSRVGVHDCEDEDELGVEENEVEWGEARSLSLRVGVPEDAQWERERTGGRRAEVALSDLLIARKPRRGREQDFELVPPLRSVIVLDDITAPAELDLDEPWEHVCASDADEKYDPTEFRVSYANIVALS